MKVFCIAPHPPPPKTKFLPHSKLLPHNYPAPSLTLKFYLTFSSLIRCTVDKEQTPCQRGSGDGGGGDHGDGGHGDGGHGDDRGALRCANDDQFHCNCHRSPSNTNNVARNENEYSIEGPTFDDPLPNHITTTSVM